MKRLRNPRRYRFRGLPDGHGLLLFAQRMEEALFEYSLDSYKAPALNTHSRCIELLRTLDEIESGHVHRGVLRSLVDELCSSIRSDYVARRLLGPAATSASELRWWDTDNPEALRAQADFVRGRLWFRAYERALREELITLVPNGKSKDRILSATTSLVVEWMVLGYSHDFIYYVSKRYFWTIQPKPLNDKSLEEFFGHFDAKRRPFTVVVRTGQGWTPTAQMLNPELAELSETAPAARTKLPRERDFLAAPTSHFLVLKDIEALEPRAASEEALRRLRTLHSAVILQRHKGETDWEPECLVYEGDHPVVLRPRRDPMHREEECSDQVLPDRIARSLQALGGPHSDSNSAHRILSALGLHASAVRSDEPSVQLLSLWSALESLLPASGDGARIVDIRERLSPALSISYPLKLLRHLHESLLHCAPKELDEALKGVSPESAGLHRLALLLYDVSHKPALERLVERLSFNPLLRYRLYLLWKSLASPSDIRSLIKDHEQRVSWHIERVYRCRNLLVHSGRHFPYLETLVENVHRYFHRIVAEVLESLTASPPSVDLDSAVLGIQIRYQAHLDYLASFSAKPFGDMAVLRDCFAGPGGDWAADPLQN